MRRPWGLKEQAGVLENPNTRELGEGAGRHIWPRIMIAGKLPELWLASQQVREQAWTRGEGKETKAHGPGCKLSLYTPVFLVNLIYKGLKGLSGRGRW